MGAVCCIQFKSQKYSGRFSYKANFCRGFEQHVLGGRIDASFFTINWHDKKENYLNFRDTWHVWAHIRWKRPRNSSEMFTNAEKNIRIGCVDTVAVKLLSDNLAHLDLAWQSLTTHKAIRRSRWNLHTLNELSRFAGFGAGLIT